MQNFAFFNAFSIDPSDACVLRAFVRAVNECFPKRARGRLFFLDAARARVSFFKTTIFDFVSFVSVEHTHPATMMDFIQIETRSSFAHRRVVNLQNQQIGLGSGRLGLGLGLGLATMDFISFYISARASSIHPSIHPSIHRASCVEGGTATAMPTVMPPVMPRRRRRRRNGGGGTFRDGEDAGAGGVTRRTNA